MSNHQVEVFGATDSLFAMVRPDLFSTEMTWLAIAAVLSALVSLILLVAGRGRELQSNLLLVSLAAVLISTVLVKLGGDKLSVVYGCFIAYLITSVWLERQSWSDHAGATERFLFSVPLVVALAAGIQWLQLQALGDMTFGQSIYVLILVMLALMAVIGDAQRVMVGGRSMQLSRDRLRWRLCFAVHVLVASGVTALQSKLVLSMSLKVFLFLPECALLVATLYYLLRSYADPIPDWISTRSFGSGSTLRA